MAFLLMLMSLALLWWLGGPSAFQAALSPQGLTLSANASKEDLTLRADLTIDAQGLWPTLSASWSPPAPPTLTITFTTDSSTCILVQPGQVLQVGDLIGYASAEAQQRLAELTQRLPGVSDEFVRAEAQAEIERLRKTNEIRALIPGRILSVTVEQQGAALRVHILLAQGKP